MRRIPLSMTLTFLTGLTSKSERAAVGEAAQKWSQLISPTSSKELNVLLSSEVFNRSAIKVRVVFQDRAFKADQKVGISVYLNYNVPKTEDASSCLLFITNLTLGIQWRGKDQTKDTSLKDLEWDRQQPLEMAPGQTHMQHFELIPASEDVGKKLVAHHVILKLGKIDGLQMRLEQRLPIEEVISETTTTLAEFSSLKRKNIHDLFLAEIEKGIFR